MNVMDFAAADYWHGYTLHAGGAQSLLLASLTNNERPSNGGPYHWTTNQDWWVSCLSSLAGPTINGSVPAGEGFFARGPDGSKYWFNHLSKRRVDMVTKQGELDPDGYGARRVYKVYRAEYLMLPTRVEDRFGNWTTYAWSNDEFSRLTSVSSGQVGSTTAERTISLQYNANGFVSSATDGRQTPQGATAYWTYEYTGSSLTKVNLPDGSFWQYGLADVSNLASATPNCEWAHVLLRAGGHHLGPLQTPTSPIPRARAPISSSAITSSTAPTAAAIRSVCTPRPSAAPDWRVLPGSTPTSTMQTFAA
jgi:hypothetical protein